MLGKAHAALERSPPSTRVRDHRSTPPPAVVSGGPFRRERIRPKYWSSAANKTSLIATAALALFAIPAVASAASLQYDPASKDNGASHFVVVESSANPATVAAAKADAARYDVGTSSALIATHGDTGARIVTETATDDSSVLFVQKVVIDNPANAEAAKADAARFAHPVFYGSQSDEEAAKLRG
jgi:hypothetical protein